MTGARLSPSRGRARIGIVTPFSNTNLEADLALLRPWGVSCHIVRAGGYDLDAVPDGAQMRRFAQASLDGVLELLMAARPDVVLYGCTSATMAMGPDYDRAFRARIEAAAGVPAVTAAGALIEALDALGAETVGFCSPYTEALARQAAAFLEAAGRRVVRIAHVGADFGNYGQGALSPEEVLALARRADHARAEAIVLSCTDMRAVEAIAALEDETGKPAVTSNQAMMHAAIARLHLPDRVPGRLGELGRAGAPHSSEGALASIARA